MKSLLALLLLLTMGLCRAADMGDATGGVPVLYPEYYDTLDEAGVAGVLHAYAHSQFYEYGGVILVTTNGKFRVSVPVTSYEGDAVVWRDHTITTYAGYFVVGDYHTHTCLPYSHYPGLFSDTDVRSNTLDGTVGYMGDLCSGVVRRFVPGVTAEDHCWIEDLLVSKGEEIFCGASGETIGKIRLSRRPIVVEFPGPLALKRGILSW